MGNATDRRAVLRRLWYEWTDVVELYARRRHGRAPRREAYGRLYDELIAACRDLAGAGGPRQELYGRLLGLAEPWLVLAAFEVADPEILEDLWRHSRRAGRELGGRPWGQALRRGAHRLPTALLLLALVCGAGWGAARYGRRALLLVEDEYRPLLFAARRFENVSLLAGAALAVVGLGIYLVSRVARG